MHFWSLLSTTEEGELGQRGGEEGGGGERVHPYLTLMAETELLLQLRDSIHAWLVFCIWLSTLQEFHLRFSVFMTRKVTYPPFLYNQMCFTLFRRVAFSFQHSTMYSQCYFKMCISSSAVFINNLLFQFTYFESVPWLMGGLFCLFVYQGMKNSYCALFEQKLSRFSVNGTWD